MNSPLRNVLRQHTVAPTWARALYPSKFLRYPTELFRFVRLHNRRVTVRWPMHASQVISRTDLFSLVLKKAYD